MILALRKNHRRVFAALGVVLPIVFVVGVAARRPVPSVTELPTELTGPAQSPGVIVWERTDLFTNAPVTVRLLRNEAGGLALALWATGNFVRPDLIAYWVAGQPKVTDELPEDAVLLGTFGASPLALPTEATTREGLLILFSLANQEIVDVSRKFVAADVRRRIGGSKLNNSNLRLVTSAATEN